MRLYTVAMTRIDVVRLRRKQFSLQTFLRLYTVAMTRIDDRGGGRCRGGVRRPGRNRRAPVPGLTCPTPAASRRPATMLDGIRDITPVLVGVFVTLRSARRGDRRLLHRLQRGGRYDRALGE